MRDDAGRALGGHGEEREKDPEVAHEADPAVVGAASQLFEHGEALPRT